MNIIGRLTRDAEVRTTSQDKQVVNFSVAVNDSYQNKEGERIEQTAYFDCSYWKTPNVVKMLTKGLLVELTGRISTRAWIGKDGEPKAGLNFHTSDIKPLAGGRKAETVQATAQSETNSIAGQSTEDDLPF
ncbi:single-stranded DNA-binding protein [Flavobacterium dauae]|uniref:single-stranded DNA-binding protein n=1 Tax=Flavobacterium dauae TaxID=1563479 RepID=UPI00101B4B10|nr:single-stranded DNA-binding protein [Flavobacterium dauae]WLD24284.1 single-stranded DNA-binding protein [Flavobacterium dauae]